MPLGYFYNLQPIINNKFFIKKTIINPASLTLKCNFIYLAFIIYFYSFK